MSLKPGDVIKKDPDSVFEPYVMDWTAYLSGLSVSETITASVWTVTDGPDSLLTLSGSSIVSGSLMTQTKLSAGTLGAAYILRNRITTSSGVIDDRSVTVLLVSK